MAIKYDNCKNCHSLCIHAGKDREFVCINGVSCKITMEKPLDTKIYGGKGRMKFKDFEIRPTCFIDGHIDPKKWDVVKWQCHNPIEVTDLETGEKKISTRSCYSVAQIWWNDKEPCWEFKSIGTRFLEDYQEGLCEFILKWLELTDLTRKFPEEA